MVKIVSNICLDYEKLKLSDNIINGVFVRALSGKELLKMTIILF